MSNNKKKNDITIYFTIKEIKYPLEFKDVYYDAYREKMRSSENDGDYLFDEDLDTIKTKTSIQRRIENGKVNIKGIAMEFKKTKKGVKYIGDVNISFKNIPLIQPYMLFIAKAQDTSNNFVESYDVTQIIEIVSLPLRIKTSVYNEDYHIEWIKELFSKELGCSLNMTDELIKKLHVIVKNREKNQGIESGVIIDEDFEKLDKYTYENLKNNSLYFMHKELCDIIDVFCGYISINISKFYKSANLVTIKQLSELITKNPWELILEKNKKKYCIENLTLTNIQNIEKIYCEIYCVGKCWDIAYIIAFLCKKIMNDINRDTFITVKDLIKAILKSKNILKMKFFKKILESIQKRTIILKRKKNKNLDEIIYSLSGINFVDEKIVPTVLKAIQWLSLNDELILIKSPENQEEYKPIPTEFDYMDNYNETDRIYKMDVFNAQCSILNRLKSLFENDSHSKCNEIDLKNHLKKLNLNPNKGQFKAIKKALESPYLQITGEAGTGKTFVLEALVKLLDVKGNNIMILSAYGISEETIIIKLFNGKSPSDVFKNADVRIFTIDMAYMLSKTYSKSHYLFLSNLTHVFVDEAQNNTSNLKSKVFFDLCKRSEKIVAIYEFGDWFQIEPIGPGDPFNQIGKALPQYRVNLTQNMRVINPKSKSIVHNARLIRTNESNMMKKIHDDISSGVKFVESKNQSDIISNIIQIYNQCKENKMNIMNISIVTPNKKDVKFINSKMEPIRQMILKENPTWNGNLCLPFRPSIKVGCKIKFLKRYDSVEIELTSSTSKEMKNKLKIKKKKQEYDVFFADHVKNNEIAWVSNIEKMGQYPHSIYVLTLYPHNKKICVGFKQVDVFDIDQGWCRTIHGTLGSQDDIIITYLGSRINLSWVTRKIIYTACSRPTNLLYVLGKLFLLDEKEFYNLMKYRNIHNKIKYNNMQLIDVKTQFIMMATNHSKPIKSDLSFYIKLLATELNQIKTNKLMYSELLNQVNNLDEDLIKEPQKKKVKFN